MESVNFQISAIGAALRPGNRPFWYLGDTARFSQRPAAPKHGLGSIPMAALHIWPVLYTGPGPGQYGAGEPQRADVGRGRCGLADVADLGGVGEFRQGRPAAEAGPLGFGADADCAQTPT